MAFFIPQKSSSKLVLGILIGLFAGFACCATVAVILTNTPIPFVDKVEHMNRPVDVTRLDNKDPNEGLKEFLSQSGDKGDTISNVERVTATQQTAPDQASENASPFMIRVGAFRTEKAAESVCADLALKGIEAEIFPARENEMAVYKVYVTGPFKTEEEARQLQQLLLRGGYKSVLERS